MKFDLYQKICDLDHLSLLSRQYHAKGETIVHCHGCFDIVHPGHLRYLQFASHQGDVLIVSITSDDGIEKADGTRPYVPQELRAESLAAIEFVSHVIIADDPTAEPIINAIKPDVYIKGKEYENSNHAGFLSERKLVESLGGSVIFSSGDIVFSSTEIVQELETNHTNTCIDDTTRLHACCSRWGVDYTWARQITNSFAGKRVAVVGDAICDQYMFCDATGIASDAPVLSLRQLKQTIYPGGAAIIACHLRALGAEPHLITTIADDEATKQIIATLDEQGISHTTFTTRQTLPTKRRYLVDTQNVLKVEHAQSLPMDSTTQRKALAVLSELRTTLDAVIFADFGYGTITSPLITQSVDTLRPHVPVITGAISGVRRTLLAMNRFDLVTPTERELRSVMGDFEQSLPNVASRVMKQLNIPNMAVTMGRRGAVLFHPREDDPAQWFNSRLRSEYMPALTNRAIDPVGAGDAMLATMTLALTCNATLPQANYLGAAQAAVAITKLGNQPVNTNELCRFIAKRPELQ